MQRQHKKSLRIRLGIFLMIFSGVFFGITFIIPLFGFESKNEIAAITASLILMEVVFWLGGLLVGKELFKKYKFYLNPFNWVKKTSNGQNSKKSLT